MKKYLLTITLVSMAQGANAALYCEGEAQCFTKAVSLITRASKAGCTSEAQKLATELQDTGKVSTQTVHDAEYCVEKAKAAQRLQKAAQKRQERIKKALNPTK